MLCLPEIQPGFHHFQLVCIYVLHDLGICLITDYNIISTIVWFLLKLEYTGLCIDPIFTCLVAGYVIEHVSANDGAVDDPNREPDGQEGVELQLLMRLAAEELVDEADDDVDPRPPAGIITNAGLKHRRKITK